MQKRDIIVKFAKDFSLHGKGSTTTAHVKQFTPFSLNIRGKLHEFCRPAVMGILNVTPDSFYSKSCDMDIVNIERHVAEMIKDGVDIIDIGGYSSRPGATDVSASVELDRLLLGIDVTRRTNRDIPISIDTFRADVARKAIEAGADIVNDISGGDIDDKMFDTIADLNVPYILMHMRGTPQTMTQMTDYDNVTANVISSLSVKVNKLSLMGVNDVIIDPGFGFSKTLEQNYQMLAELNSFESLQRPLLVGISRKSMIYNLLGTTPSEALNGTTAINTIALMSGASILRVHDVKSAIECVNIYMKTTSQIK